MGIWIFIFCFIYTVIGFGLFRLVNHVNSVFGHDCQNNFLTIAFWPFIMVMFAWNNDLHKIIPVEEPEDLSRYTL